MKKLWCSVNEDDYERIVHALDTDESIYAFVKTAVHNELVSRGG